MEDNRLVTELMHEVKMSAKRWFIAFVIMVAVEIATIAGFLWYVSLPTDEVSIETEDGNANYIGRDLEGDLYNGKDNSQEKGNKN